MVLRRDVKTCDSDAVRRVMLASIVLCCVAVNSGVMRCSVDLCCILASYHLVSWCRVAHYVALCGIMLMRCVALGCAAL